MRPLIYYLRPLAPKSLTTTSDWAGVEQVSSELSRVSILHGCPPTVTWHQILSYQSHWFWTYRCGAMITIKTVPFDLNVGASFYSSLSIENFLGWSRGDAMSQVCNCIKESQRYLSLDRPLGQFQILEQCFKFLQHLTAFLWRLLNHQVLTVLGYTEVTSGRVW